MIQREFALRFPVSSWLHDRGLDPILEAGALNNCDVVGVRYDQTDLVEMVAVELKLSRVGECLDQCARHVKRVTETWAAFPIDVARRQVERFDVAGGGVGLLGVRGQCVDVLVAAQRFDGRNLSRWRWTYIRRRHQWRSRMLVPNMAPWSNGRPSAIAQAEAERLARLQRGRLAEMNRSPL